MADALVKRVEAFLPGLTEATVFREVGTPRTHRRFLSRCSTLQAFDFGLQEASGTMPCYQQHQIFKSTLCRLFACRNPSVRLRKFEVIAGICRLAGMLTPECWVQG